jgi:hypothetical protein
VTDHSSRGQSRRIVTATAVAAAIAAVILVVAVLPAEYGVDPLGTGRALGLGALSGTAPAETAAPAASTVAVGAASSKTTPFATDVYTVELRPFEGVEYKYRLHQHAALIYAWEASASVEFEFHGEPDGAPEKYFDSYSKGTAATGQGTFTAAKAGVHGWFWKNHSADRVTVKLRSAGFYGSSTEYRDGEKMRRTFPVESASKEP